VHVVLEHRPRHTERPVLVETHRRDDPATEAMVEVLDEQPRVPVVHDREGIGIEVVTVVGQVVPSVPWVVEQVQDVRLSLLHETPPHPPVR
jgi:hypothetical protein